MSALGPFLVPGEGGRPRSVTVTRPGQVCVNRDGAYLEQKYARCPGCTKLSALWHDVHPDAPHEQHASDFQECDECNTEFCHACLTWVECQCCAQTTTVCARCNPHPTCLQCQQVCCCPRCNLTCEHFCEEKDGCCEREICCKCCILAETEGIVRVVCYACAEEVDADAATATEEVGETTTERDELEEQEESE